jgi:transposase
MSRNPKNPLRPLLEEERQQLIRLSRGQVIAASSVARAKALLAIADGYSYTDAARAVGRQSGDAVASLVARFNTEGLAAVVVRHGGGHRPHYSPEERERILVEARRVPDREQDGTARWSLSTLARRIAPEWLTAGQYRHDSAGVSGRGLEWAKTSVVVRHGAGATPAQAQGSDGRGHRHRSGCRG